MLGEEQTFQRRLRKHHEELRWLYMELYQNSDMFAELCTQMYEYYMVRRKNLKERDEEREANPEWFKKNDMLGMMLYIDNFAGCIEGVR